MAVLSCGEFLDALEKGEITIGDFSESVKLAPILHNGKVLRIQTPQMQSTFGINLPYASNASNASNGSNDRFKNNKETPDPNANHTINLSFNNIDKRKSLMKFMSAIEKMNDGVMNKASERSIDWFKRKLDLESIQARFNSNIKKSMSKVDNPDKPGQFMYKENARYAPSFRCTLHRSNGDYVFDTCDEKYEPIDLNKYDTKGAQFTAILKCAGVYVMNQSFGISWKVEQMRVISPPTLEVPKIQFREEENEDENKKKAPKTS